MNINELEFEPISKYHLPSKIARYFTTFFSTILIIFSFSVIIGWLGHIEVLYRYQADTIAMVVNTSICFILSSCAIFFIMNDIKYIPEFFVGLVLLICGLVFVQQIFNIDLGIDQLFLNQADSMAKLHPGRMAPNTLFCFFMSSITLLLFRFGAGNKYCVIIGAILSMLLFTLALLIILGYFSSVPELYLWGEITPMAYATAVGFIIFSSALTSLSLHESIVDEISVVKYLPFIMALCIFIGSIVLTVDIGQHEMQNHYSTNLPLLVLFSGTVAAIILGLLSFLALISITRARQAKDLSSILQTTIEASADGIVVFNMQGKLVVYNKKFVELWNIDESTLASATRQSLIRDNVFQVLNKEEYFIKTKRLAKYPDIESTDEIATRYGKVIERHVRPQMMNGKQIGRVFTYRDITLQKRLESQLMHQATYDALTDLPNRALLLDLIHRNIEEAKKNNTVLGLFLIDIDKFSHINDLFGRSKGDFLLKTIASALKDKLPPDCILGRIGGDEFMIISYNVTRPESSTRLINTILSTVSTEFNLYGHDLKVSCCIGVAFYPKDGQETDILLANADIAMLRAKKEGRNSFQFYTQDLNSYTLRNIQLETQLHKALEDKEFIVYYQPILDLQTRKSVGVEALVRWKNKHGEIIPPDEFIPLAEEIGLIEKIGEFVLRTACLQAKQWAEVGMPDLKISVNISPYQVKSGNFADLVNTVLQETTMDPRHLNLELTENSLIHSNSSVLGTLEKLYRMGIGISIDDFGTGYSSFNYVKKFPISNIKIDRGFVSDAVNIAEDRAIVSAMVLLAHSLHFTVIAEGVETVEQLKFLQSLGCELGQGFYFARPMPADECTIFLQKN